MQRYAPCYVEEVRQFIECVRDETPTPTTGEDGRAAVVLGYAAWKSLRENRPVKGKSSDWPDNLRENCIRCGLCLSVCPTYREVSQRDGLAARAGGPGAQRDGR